MTCDIEPKLKVYPRLRGEIVANGLSSIAALEALS